MSNNNQSQSNNAADCFPIGIFISHRSEDDEIARLLKTKLRRVLAKDKVEVHICGSTQGEKSWRQWIEEKIKASQVMIFLYTVQYEETWRWCMYEIGMFNGLRLIDKNRKLVFLKNPHIKVKEIPDPLKDVTFYEADKSGIEEFLNNLLFEGIHTPNGCKIITKEERSKAAYDENFYKALDLIDVAFRRSRLHIEYYTYRITIDLNLNGPENEEFRIEKSKIKGDEKTMNILNLPPKTLLWNNFKKNFEETGQKKWIQELEKIPENVVADKVVNKVLHPISIEKNGQEKTYLPVVSSIEKMHPHIKDGPHEPTKFNVIFIPQLISQEGLLERLPTRIPFSKVKCWLDPSDDLLFKDFAKNGGKLIIPQVVEMNPMCLSLYALSQDDFSKGSRKWTGLDLIERLRKLDFVDQENIQKLIEDQGDVIDKLLLKGLDHTEASIPLQFNDNHPRYPNQCFLPVVISKQIEGDPTKRHTAYLIVAYVKDFWPADHEVNPFNIKMKESQG